MNLSPARISAPELLSDVLGHVVALNEREPIAAATILHSAGLCVFPVVYGSKDPFRGMHWQVFKTTRLAEDDLEIAFAGACNLAVMTGRQSGNLLVVDCETPRQFGTMQNRVLSAGLPLWAASTARGGHVYLRCVDGEIANLKGSEVEVRGCGCYVLAPPSVHPSGVRYTWETRNGQQPPALALRDLREVLGLCLTLENRRGKGRGISQATQDFLAGRTAKGERNNQLYTAARELLATGYTVDDARDQLVGAAQACGLSAREAHKTFESAAEAHDRDGIKAYSRDHDKPRAWQLATAWSKSRTWPGRTGATDRAIFLAHCERMHREAPRAVKSPSWRASQRELAELAHVTQGTATAATQRLVDSRMLVRQPGKHHEANRYCLGEAVAEAVLHPVGPAEDEIRSLYKSASNSDPISSSVGDAFERGALPKHCADLLAVMQQNDWPAMPTALARQSGLTVPQTKYALSRLDSFGLVKHSADGWLMAVPGCDLLDELQRIAGEAGTMGKGQKRREKHARDRQKYALDIVKKARQQADQHPHEYKRNGRQ